jgi:hypothetical protein
VSQAKSHAPPVHVACALKGAVHGVHDDPHVSGDVSSAHAPPHA